jgi:hypothetical protein
MEGAARIVSRTNEFEGNCVFLGMIFSGLIFSGLARRPW